MSGAAVPPPDFLFEVTYCDQMNAKFAETRGEQDLIYAFHGSRLENFHSILHNGLHCHLNRVRLLVLLMGTNPRWSPAATNTWTGCSPLTARSMLTSQPCFHFSVGLGLQLLSIFCSSLRVKMGSSMK